MQTLLGLPLWAIALIASAFVPFAARAWGAMAERHVKERSVRQLAALGSNAGAQGEQGMARPDSE